MGRKEFYRALTTSADKLRTQICSGKDISIIARNSADGLVSAGILTFVIFNSGGRCSVRFVRDLTREIILKTKNEDHEFQVLADVGVGLSKELRNSFGGNWLALNHERIANEEITTDDENCILNPWKFGIDGERDISSGGVSYLIAKTIDKKYLVLSPLSIVSALGENQDIGEKKSFVGLNSELCDESVGLGTVNREIDMLFMWKDSKPIHISLANTLFPYIHGLTWNDKNCQELIRTAGIPLTVDGRWRTSSETSQEEKFVLIEAITKYINEHSASGPQNLENLFAGYSYTLVDEEEGTALRDAREFSFLLACCCIRSRPSIGLAVCAGNRSKDLLEATHCLADLELEIKDSVKAIMSERWRITDDGINIWVIGDNVTKDYNFHIVSALLSSYSDFYGKILIVRTVTINGNYKYSVRKSRGCRFKQDLGVVLNQLSAEVGGSANGSDACAECVIPFSKIEDFSTSFRSLTRFDEREES